jgi:hypothetical protein
MDLPQTERELLADILRAEAAEQDLQETEDGLDIYVCAMARDGDLYELGSVSATFCHQNPHAAHRAISRIKFAARNKMGGSK